MLEDDAEALCVCRFLRKAHLQIVLGVPGVGKTTFMTQLGRLILDRMDREPEWLTQHGGFRECLRSCLDTSIPHVFTLVHAQICLSILRASHV